MQKRRIHPTWFRQAALAAGSLCFGLTIGCGGGGGGAATASGVSLSLASPAAIQATVMEGASMPNQTITVQATGDLNSLAGKQIYVSIVDPDSLFNLPPTLYAAAGPNGTYSATLPGNVLSALGTCQGNLQIKVGTDPTFSRQLGNCPLTIPYAVTVAAAPSLTLVSPVTVQATVTQGGRIPDQTITMQASGNLDVLNGQTLYANIVDPDYLFNLGIPLVITSGANSTFSLTVSGQALNNLGTLQGNLQIKIGTDWACTHLLGNCPLSLPYSVTVNPVIPTVTGTSLVTNLLFNAGNGSVTPAAPVPNGLPIINAILSDGTVRAGSYNTGTGAYSIANVPAGSYVLQANDSYIWTSSHSVDLGWSRGGRRPAADSLAAQQTFNLSNLAAWNTGDYLLGFDFNSSLYVNLPNASNGQTALNASLPWLDRPLVDTTQGDAPQVIQYAASVNGTVHTSNPVASGVPTALTMVNGGNATTPVALSALAATDTVFVNFKRSQFAGYRAEYNPHATVPMGPFFEVDSTPGATFYGNAGQWMDGYTWQDQDASNITDVNLGNQATPPVPAGFERIYYAGETHYLDLTAPGATTPFSYYVKGIRSYSLTGPTNSTPLRVLVSPVTNPEINGQNLFQTQSGVGLTPLLTWSLPDVGMPTGFMVTIFQLTNTGGATQSTQLCRLFLPSNMYSVRVPAGIMQIGNAYNFLITAYVDQSYDPTTAPWADHKFPYGMSQTISSMVTP